MERDALAGHGWHVHAVVGRTSRAQRADGALVGLAAVVEAIRETWESLTTHAPMAQQLADAAHERRIAEVQRLCAELEEAARTLAALQGEPVAEPTS